VATSGSDTNSGTATSPWKTLSKAANTALPGDVVCVRAGSHAGFTMTRSGTASAPIQFVGYPGDSRPVIDGTIGLRADVVRFSGNGYISLTGFIVQNAQGGAFYGSGIKTDSTAHHITITDNIIRENQSFGIYPHASRHLTITNNDIYGNAAGIYVSWDGEGTVIANNDIHNTDRMIRNTVGGNDDAGGDAIVFHKGAGKVLVENNRMWANRATSYDYAWDGGALSIYGASNITFRKNTMWDNENILETGTDGTSGLSCSNNVFVHNVARGDLTVGRAFGLFVRCATDMLIAHNTITNVAFGFSLGSDSATYSNSIDGLRIVNNVVSLQNGKVYGIEQTAPLPSTVVIDNNIEHSMTGDIASVRGVGTTKSLATFTSWTGFDRNGSQADPLFVNRTANDYRLQAGSPAIDRGSRLPGLNDGYSGGAPDAGRYER